MTKLRTLGLSALTALTFAACQKAPEQMMEVRSYSTDSDHLYEMTIKEVPVSLRDRADSVRHAFDLATSGETSPEKTLREAFKIIEAASQDDITVFMTTSEKNYPMAPEGTFYLFTACKDGATYTPPPIHTMGRVGGF